MGEPPLTIAGPSPRGRGNQSRAVLIALGNGTIPAWAGEPCRHSRRSRRSRDHPRVGGGTKRGRLSNLFEADHPRVGGGTGGQSADDGGGQGPSPRGRGNRRLALPGFCVAGTIPAWAGEPSDVHLVIVICRDHPRVGGGTIRALPPIVFFPGPSPRGRGNLNITAAGQTFSGTIPAWAGEPTPRSMRWRRQGDHPRVGGGTTSAPYRMGRGSGPSPRGRGNLFDALIHLAGMGTIPAWAGEPGALA